MSASDCPVLQLLNHTLVLKYTTCIKKTNTKSFTKVLFMKQSSHSQPHIVRFIFHGAADQGSRRTGATGATRIPITKLKAICYAPSHSPHCHRHTTSESQHVANEKDSSVPHYHRKESDKNLSKLNHYKKACLSRQRAPGRAGSAGLWWDTECSHMHYDNLAQEIKKPHCHSKCTHFHLHSNIFHED